MKKVLFILTFIILTILLSGCVCPPNDWDGPWPPWCEKGQSYDAPSTENGGIQGAIENLPNSPFGPIELNNVIFRIAVSNETNNVSLLIGDKKYDLEKNGAIFYTIINSLIQDTNYSYLIDEKNGPTGKTKQINYNYFKGNESLPEKTQGGTFMVSGTKTTIDEQKKEIDYFTEFGFDTFVIIPDWFIYPDKTGTEIKPHYTDEPNFENKSGWIQPTRRDSELKELINYAKSKGLKIVIKPHVDPINFGEEKEADRTNLDPTSWSEWMDSYKTFILHYAKLAQEVNADTFVIGTELTKATGEARWGNYNENAKQDWEEIISEIKKVYSGKLTYSSACWNGNCDNPKNIEFWDKLDYIGIEPYMGITNKDDPTVEEMSDGFKKKFEEIMKPLYEKYHKKIILSEVNVYAFDGVNQDPISISFGENRKVDQFEQANWYEALFQAIKDTDYIQGYYIWAYYQGGNNQYSYQQMLNDNGDSIPNRIAGQVIKKWQNNS